MGERLYQPQVAIDGPAASGKSTVAMKLARRLGVLLIDSGSMYRTVTLTALEEGVAVEDHEALIRLARRVSEEFRLNLSDDGLLEVFMGDRDVTEEIRSPLVGSLVSPVSEVRGVRDEMVRLQRQLALGAGAVMEGRDIGTTVLPAADLKVYLDASVDERARRRFDELRAKGGDVTFEQVRSEIETRDRIDSSREVSPLARAPDALMIDTDDMDAERVVDEVMGMLMDRGLV